MNQWECVKLLLHSILVFILLPQTYGGAGECRRYVGARTIECYDCDSRFDPHCAVIDENNLNSIKPFAKPCKGCCVKFFHKLANGEHYIHRMCTEHIIINYFMVDHVCMSEGKGRGKMCFCEENLCNGGMVLSASAQIGVLLVLTVLASVLGRGLFI